MSDLNILNKATKKKPNNRSLWVGNLSKDVTEHDLYRIFSMVGPVSSVFVCADAVSSCSLGYGYVNFADCESAQKALDLKNYEEVSGKNIRVMWAERDPNLRRCAVGNVFIKNLNRNIDTRSLHDSLSQFGPILSCKVALDKDGKSKGYGFVHFEYEEDAHECIEQVNGKEIEGKEVTVGSFLPRSERINDKEARFTNVFVKNLAKNVDDHELKSLFESHGSITSLVVMKDTNGVSKGFGFVNFSTPEEAQIAVQSKHKYVFHGEELGVFRAQKKAERESMLSRQFEERKRERFTKYHGLNLYVKNFPIDFSDVDLHKQFCEFGTVTSCKIMYDSTTGRSKGFGFVCFSNASEARRAMTEMKTRTYFGKPFYTSLAQAKEARRKHLEMQFRIRTSSQHSIQSLGLLQSFRPHIGPMLVQTKSKVPVSTEAFSNRSLRSHRQGNLRTRVKNNNLREQSVYFRRISTEKPSHMAISTHPHRVNKGSSTQLNNLKNGCQASGGKDISALTAILATLPQEQRIHRIGEEIYPLVKKHQSELAGKITGLFLDMEIGELLGLLQNPAHLAENINAAVQVLRQSGVIQDGISSMDKDMDKESIKENL